MSAVIELDGLSVRLGRRQILKNLTCKLQGRAIGLLGPNGAGKTTLINTLLGFYRPNNGRASVFGHDIKHTREIRRLVGYMPERDSFVAGMSCVRFVSLMAELSGLPANAALERAHEALFFVGLGEARYRNIETYSLGMKQMAKLAQAIAHGPRLIILDEPTNGLDPPTRARMLKLIREIRDSGQTHVILSSHLLRDVEECCEEILILKEGQIAVYCDLEQERRSNTRFIEMEVRGEQVAFIDELESMGCECAATGRQRVKAILPEGVEVRDLYKVAERLEIQIRRLNYKRDSLEEIFLKAMMEVMDGAL